VDYLGAVHPGELVYESAVRLLVPALRIASPFHEKLRRGVAGRRESLRSLHEWSTLRDASRPLLWLHAPSVGEALMAQAILAAARDRDPTLQAIFTFFSPSAERVAGRIGADWSGYLPWDRRGDMRHALRLARPTHIAFVRTEIWPILMREAASDVRIVLVNAVLADGSSRTGAGARALLGHAYASLDDVGAVSDVDAERFTFLGVQRRRIHVTGDARFDQVWQRIAALRGTPSFTSHRRVLVAGSTWLQDEQRLLPCLPVLGDGWTTVIAPHEPNADHVTDLEARIDALRLTHARLPADSSAALPDVDVVVVDRVGVLADLYANADMAYVGGGFGKDGLHSVVEPAALGVPVAFGPRHGNAREGGALADAGGGFIARDSEALRAIITELARDDVKLGRAAEAAREFVKSRLGGAARNAALILDG